MNQPVSKIFLKMCDSKKRMGTFNITAMMQPVKSGMIMPAHRDRAPAMAPIFCTPRNIRIQTAAIPMIHFANAFLFTGEKFISTPLLFSDVYKTLTGKSIKSFTAFSLSPVYSCIVTYFSAEKHIYNPFLLLYKIAVSYNYFVQIKNAHSSCSAP